MAPSSSPPLGVEPLLTSDKSVLRLLSCRERRTVALYCSRLDSKLKKPCTITGIWDQERPAVQPSTMVGRWGTSSASAAPTTGSAFM